MSNKRALHPWEGRDNEQLVTYITIKCKLSWVIRKKIYRVWRESAKVPGRADCISHRTIISPLCLIMPFD